MIKKLFHGRRVNFEKECRVNGERGANVEHSLQHVNMYKVCFQISYKYILFSQRCIYIYIDMYCRRFLKDIEIFVRNFHLIYTHFELLWLSIYIYIESHKSIYIYTVFTEIGKIWKFPNHKLVLIHLKIPHIPFI